MIEVIDRFIYLLAIVPAFIVGASVLLALFYRVGVCSDPAGVELVIVTVGSERVADTLLENVEYHLEEFSDQSISVVTDEGAFVVDELRAWDGVDLHVVPEGYDIEAKAKGRAVHWFIESFVVDSEWYVFIDDDNRLLDDRFLYEIPRQESAGRLVGNGVLVPREGDSRLSFVIDHARTFWDLTLYRATTGTLESPLAGLHGELLIARGDVLNEVGFNRLSIVEDFAFADELCRRNIDTWQSRTRVSILSPHSVGGLFRQRTRWLTGIGGWLPNCSYSVSSLMLLVMASWYFSVFMGWVIGLSFHVMNPGFPDLRVLVVNISLFVSLNIPYAVGVIRSSDGVGVRRVLDLLFVFPYVFMAALVEQLLPLGIAVDHYIVSRIYGESSSEFFVLEK